MDHPGAADLGAAPVSGPDRPAAGDAAALVVAPAARTPVEARGLALAVVAALASIYALSWAQSFLVPLLLGIVISYALNPVVVALESIRIPRAAGTALVMTSLIGALAFGTYALRGEMQTIVEQLPEAASKFAGGLARLQSGQAGALQKVQRAASTVESAATQAPAVTAPPRQDATHVIVDAPKFKLGSFLWQNTLGLVGVLAEAAMVTFLVFFLLLGGDTFKRKLVRLAGPTLARRRITVQILDDINGSIQKYMLMLLATNLMVALLSWLAFHWIGLDNAGAWGAAAGLLHVVPYLGPCVTAVATGMAAFMQFDSFALAMLVAGASLTIATVVG
jgi:predicted PurR-regulated permease PerM